MSAPRNALESLSAKSGSTPRFRTALLVTLVSLGLIAIGFGYWVALPLLSRWGDPLAAGWVAYDSGDYDGAAEVARARLLDQNNDRAAIKLLARAQAQRGQRESSRRLYQRLGPEEMEVEDFYLLGDGMIQEGMDDAAGGVLEVAESLDPNHGPTLEARLRLFDRYQMPEMALLYTERLGALPGWEAVAKVAEARAFAEMLDTKGMIESLEKAFALDPTLENAPMSPDGARRFLSRAYLANGRGDDAWATLQEISKPDGDVYWLLSRAELQRGNIEAAQEARVQAEELGVGYDPIRMEPAQFVGAARCAECHESIYETQQASRHARTFQRAPDFRFDEIPASGEGIRDPGHSDVVHTLTRDGDDLVLETETETEEYRAFVEFIMGSGHHGFTMVGRDNQGDLCELRLSYYGPEVGWDLTTGQSKSPGSPHDFLGLTLAADEHRRCLGCHTTNFQASLRGEGPTLADGAIGCERCHGPGGNHLLAVEHDYDELAIAHPSSATAAQVVGLCGNCHKPLKGMSVGPSEHPSAVRFQASTLVRSPCYIKSPSAAKFDCVSCHNPHRNVETDHSFYEAVCLSCHTGSSSVSSRVAHDQRGSLEPTIPLETQVICPIEPTENCIDCHMPRRDSVMAHTKFTDHHIRVQRDVPVDKPSTIGE